MAAADPISSATASATAAGKGSRRGLPRLAGCQAAIEHAVIAMGRERQHLTAKSRAPCFAAPARRASDGRFLMLTSKDRATTAPRKSGALGVPWALQHLQGAVFPSAAQRAAGTATATHVVQYQEDQEERWKYRWFSSMGQGPSGGLLKR